MRLIIVSLVTLIALVGFAAAVTLDLFEDYCISEAQLKKKFDSLVFDKSERRITWNLFMAKRNKRVRYGEALGLSIEDCAQTLQKQRPELTVFSDEELFGQLCAEENQLRSKVANDQDAEERNQVKQLEEEARQYRTQVGEELHKSQCSLAANSVTISDEKIPTKLYYESCRQLILNDHLSMMLVKILNKIRHPGMINLASEAGSRALEANSVIKRHCEGPASYCCGKEFFAAYSSNAPVRGADKILTVALAKPDDSMGDVEKSKEEAEKNKCDLLHTIEKIYHKGPDKKVEFTEEVSRAIKEQFRQASELFSGKLHGCGTSFKIFNNLG